MAILGDQKHGTNIEAPLSTIQDAVASVLEPYLKQLIGNTQTLIEKDTNVYIGRKELFNEIRSEAQTFQKSTGRNAFI